MSSDILSEFMNGASSRMYRELIQYHIKRQGTKRIQRAALGELEKMPEENKQYAENFVDKINQELGYDQKFWASATCKEAFKQIARIATSVFEKNTFILNWETAMKQENQEKAFQIFQFATLSFAYSASLSKEMRKFVGIKKGIFG